jgi:diguanylate cyclase (GGDEF)-like protein
VSLDEIESLELRPREPLPLHARVHLLTPGVPETRHVAHPHFPAGDNVDGEGHCCKMLGLADRRRLEERLASLLRDAAARGSVLTVALADIDHFKGITDRFTPAVGEEVLRCVGEILRAQCRLGDVAGRFVGEEFMLIFRGRGIGAAAEAGERMRRAVESWDWRSIHPQLRVTLSLGLASSTSFDHPEGLLDAADHWLHEAKHHGRNQVQPLVRAPAEDTAPA